MMIAAAAAAQHKVLEQIKQGAKVNIALVIDVAWQSQQALVHLVYVG